jgi:hypothetical protein
MTLIGAYALNASGPGRSHCPPISKLAASKKEPKGGKTQPFLLLMDQVPHPAAGSKLEILYDVCGLPSGTAYRGRVRLSQQVTKAKAKGKSKKKPVQPKPLVMAFDDEVDGVATRRRQELELGSTKPGVYTLELSVVDSRGRERKKLQKLVVKPQ